MSKTIVYFCGMKVFPAQTGGHLRAAGIARALARLGYRVRVISLTGRHEDYLPPPRSGWLVEEIEPGLTEETWLGLGLGLIQAVTRRLGYTRRWQYECIQRGWLPRRLTEALHAADLVLADFPLTPPPPGMRADQPWFLVSHNLEYRILEQGTPREQAAAGWMRAVEAEAPRRYRDIFACAEEDRDFYRAQAGAAALRLPLVRCGVDPKVYQRSAAVRERTRTELGLTAEDRLLVFSGSNSWQNHDALGPLKAFCAAEQDFLVRNRLFLLLLGSMEPAPFRQGQVIATGRVPETAPYFAAADVGLNPILKGSGANVKLFEYLAALLPVISTRFGVRGSGLVEDLDYLPYEPGALRPALERYLALDSAEGWRIRAESVWQRQRQACDIEALVQQAIADLPAFQPSTHTTV